MLRIILPCAALAYFFYKNVANSLLKDINVPYAANIIAFLLIFVVTFLVIKIVQMIVARVFQWSILKSLDRTLGFVFGIVEGAAVICLAVFILSAQPFFNTQPLFEGSFYYNLIQSVFNSDVKKEIGNHV